MLFGDNVGRLTLVIMVFQRQRNPCFIVNAGTPLECQ
jgi:hypothetical protein